MRQANAIAAGSYSGKRVGERVAQLSGVRGRAREHVAGVGHHRVDVDAVEAALEVGVGAQLLGQDRLGERAQHEAVVGGDDVDGAALHGEPNHLAVEQERLQLLVARSRSSRDHRAT